MAEDGKPPAPSATGLLATLDTDEVVVVPVAPRLLVLACVSTNVPVIGLVVVWSGVSVLVVWTTGTSDASVRLARVGTRVGVDVGWGVAVGSRVGVLVAVGEACGVKLKLCRSARSDSPLVWLVAEAVAVAVAVAAALVAVAAVLGVAVTAAAAMALVVSAAVVALVVFAAVVALVVFAADLVAVAVGVGVVVMVVTVFGVAVV